MRPSPRPLYVQMGLKRSEAAQEVRLADLSPEERARLLRLIPHLPGPGEEVPISLSYAEAGEAVLILQEELKLSQPGRGTTWTFSFFHIAHHVTG